MSCTPMPWRWRWGCLKETKISLERLEKFSRNLWWYEKLLKLGMYREVFVSYLQNLRECGVMFRVVQGWIPNHIELPTEGNDVPTNVFRPVVVCWRLYSRGQGFAKRKISSTLNWRLWVDLTFRFPLVKEHGNLLHLWCSIGNASSFMVHFRQQCLVCLVTRA